MVKYMRTTNVSGYPELKIAKSDSFRKKIDYLIFKATNFLWKCINFNEITPSKSLPFQR